MMKFISGMSKSDVAIASTLVGTLAGMAVSAVCMTYSLHAEDVIAAMSKNCTDTNKAVLIDGYFFGTTLKVQCADGTVKHYPIEKLALHGNGVHVDDHRK
jgi:hypothetical protein